MNQAATTRQPSGPPQQPTPTRMWTAERLCQASYKDMESSPTQVTARFQRHLLMSCRSSLHSLLQTSSSTTRDYSLEVDAFDLLEADPVLGHMLLKFPNTLMKCLEDAIVEAQHELKRQLQQEAVAAAAAAAAAAADEGGHLAGTAAAAAAAAAAQANTARLTIKGDKGNNDGKVLAATRVHARIFHLPPTCCRTSVASMEASDVGRIIQVSGTCVRTSPVQMYESARLYKCTGKNGCSRIFLHEADLEQRNNAMVTPDRCTLGTESGGPCQGTNLQLVEDGSIHTDYQEIKIQEAASKLGVGSMPRSLLIKLGADLVDRVQPGDEVVVVGILLAQWQQSAQPGLEPNVGMALKAHSVRVIQENGVSAWQQSADGKSQSGELDKYRKEFDTYWDNCKDRDNFEISWRDNICKAVCPKLYGLSVIKLALLITLIGGVSSNSFQSTDEDEDYDAEGSSIFGASSGFAYEKYQRPDPFRPVQNDSAKGLVYGEQSLSGVQKRRTTDGKARAVQTHRRDMSHMLLIGDPGTGKSQILRFAAALCPRSVLTTGVGTTSAGLTCAAVREGNDKEFSLEAGALVLADKGICCIDEFGCIRNEDRTTIHEAMEQQTLSVAKAGIVCKLNCRATIIAVMNPRDSIYDNHDSLAANTGLGTPLLSRFDLIFKLIDSSDPERDHNVTAYLMNRAIQGIGFECTGSTTTIGGEDAPWSMEKLRAYISVVKDKFQPRIDFEAATLLERHYEMVRSAQSCVIPVTVRFLESLIRLTQSHARLCYRNKASLLDAVCVLRVMDASAYAYGGFEGETYSDPMQMDPVNLSPDESYALFEYRLLKRYKMLPYMNASRLNTALALLEGDDSDQGGPSDARGSWQSLNNPRDHCDHYGRYYLSPAPSQASQLTPTDGGNKRRRL